MSGLFDRQWEEKYRPKTLDDYICDDETRRYLMGIQVSQSFPNIMLCGIQGIGKTTLAKLIVTALVPCDYIYINASDERGIDAIRGKVQSFIETKSITGKVKAVILDEASGLTGDAQKALNSMTEEFSDTARFILTANEQNKIIASIQSRCHPLEIKSDPRQIYDRLMKILKEEGIETGKDEKKFIVDVIRNFNPDIRKMIKQLQSCVRDNKLDISSVGSFTTEFVALVMDKLKTGTRTARQFLLDNEKSFGSDYKKLLRGISDYIYADETIPNADMKLTIINNYLYKSSFVIDQELNAYCCLIELRETDNK